MVLVEYKFVDSSTVLRLLAEERDTSPSFAVEY